MLPIVHKYMVVSLPFTWFFKGHKYYFVHSFNISVLNFPNIVLLLYTFVDLIKMEKYIQIIRREVELKKTPSIYRWKSVEKVFGHNSFRNTSEIVSHCYFFLDEMQPALNLASNDDCIMYHF